MMIFSSTGMAWITRLTAQGAKSPAELAGSVGA
jgi:hypothetical protein